jgi:hypothetical protein
MKPEKSNWKTLSNWHRGFHNNYARVSIFNTTPKKKRKNWWFASKEIKTNRFYFTILIEK